MFTFGRLAAGVLLGALTMHAQIGADLKRSYESVKSNLMKSAERMPEDGYGFKPMADVRSFAEVMMHVAMAQSRTCAAAAASEGKPPEMPSGASMTGKTSKADVTAALQQAFDVCDKAYAGLTDSNASEALKTPRGTMTRAGLLAANLAHDSEQYGIVAMYLRGKGLVPPSSDKK